MCICLLRRRRRREEEERWDRRERHLFFSFSDLVDKHCPVTSKLFSLEKCDNLPIISQLVSKLHQDGRMTLSINCKQLKGLIRSEMNTNGIIPTLFIGPS